MACGLEIKTGSVTLNIQGDVQFKGGINEDGIRVHEGAELTITGAGHLYCSGNNEEERIKLNEAKLGLYYGTVGFDPAAPNAKKPDALTTAASIAAYKSHTVYNGTVEKHICGGSGIGYANHRPGRIKIVGLGTDAKGQPALKITAKGYGRGAFGIGGGDHILAIPQEGGDPIQVPNIELENVHILEARGGYSTISKIDPETNTLKTVLDPQTNKPVPANLFIYEEKYFDPAVYKNDTTKVLTYRVDNSKEGAIATVEQYVAQVLLHPHAVNKDVGLAFQQGKNEAEGGCAIGVGGDEDASTDKGWIVMKNVKIDQAIGGSKAAAIGAYYWSAVKLDIEDSDLDNIIGGNAAAAIGGSRYHGQPDPTDTTISIKNSHLNNLLGGQFGAGIGSGYNTYTTELSQAQLCHIEIEGKTTLDTVQGGMAAAGIGTGYHQSRLSGSIDTESTLQDIRAGANWADLDFATCTNVSKYLNGKPGPSGKNYSFGYYADNRYGTLSKAQDIGYGCLYTHGINLEGTPLVHKGRECTDQTTIPAAISAEFTKSLSNTEKDALKAALNTDPNTFASFETSVNFVNTYNNQAQFLTSPRLFNNNLSQNSGDSPRIWVDLGVTSALTLDAFGVKSFGLSSNGADEYSGTLEGTISINGERGVPVDLRDRVTLTAITKSVDSGTAPGADSADDTYVCASSFHELVYDLETGTWSHELYVPNSGEPGKEYYYKLTLTIAAEDPESDPVQTAVLYVKLH
jgi:hypothetical protein